MTDIPPQVLSLLHEHISGVHEIKALMLVQGNPARTWSPADVADDLRWPEEWGASALENLATAGLVVGVGDGQFSYRPTTPELDAAVAALAEIHGEDGLDVIKILNSQAFDRIRSAVSTLGDVIALAKK